MRKRRTRHKRKPRSRKIRVPPRPRFGNELRPLQRPVTRERVEYVTPTTRRRRERVDPAPDRAYYPPTTTLPHWSGVDSTSTAIRYDDWRF